MDEEWHWRKLSGLASPSDPAADKLPHDEPLYQCRLFCIDPPLQEECRRGPDVEMQDCSSFSDSSALRVCYVSVSILWWYICYDHILVSL